MDFGNTRWFNPGFWWFLGFLCFSSFSLFGVFLCFVCLRPVTLVPNVYSVSGLSIIDCPFGFLQVLAKGKQFLCDTYRVTHIYSQVR